MKIFWIVGSIMLIIVVASLGILVPRCNNQISQIQDDLAELKNKRAVRLMNYQYYLSHQLIEGQRRIDIQLLKLVKEDEAIQSANERLMKQIVEVLSKNYTLLTNRPAPIELKRKWATMDAPQLQIEISRMEEQEDLNALYDSITKKERELTEANSFRTSVLVWTTIIQVVGLLMVSFAQYFKDYGRQKSPNKTMNTDK